jgi:hypothetical protein
MTTRKMRYCFFCGAELGYLLAVLEWQPSDTCGAIECEREARAAAQEEREEAHRKLDEDMGY